MSAYETRVGIDNGGGGGGGGVVKDKKRSRVCGSRHGWFSHRRLAYWKEIDSFPEAASCRSRVYQERRGASRIDRHRPRTRGDRTMR